LFEALMHADPAPIEAQASTYLPAISKHVESVTPNKSVFAEYWCPVVVQDETGAQHVLHVDPLIIRQFRRTIAGELEYVREKRNRMLKRIQTIREELPKVQARETLRRLQREISDAKLHMDEHLLQPLPESTRTLHVFLEISPYMVQLDLICKYLLTELPSLLSISDARRVGLNVLSSDSQSDVSSSLAPFDWRDRAAWNTACEWLTELPLQRLPAKGGSKKKKRPPQGFHFARAFRWATTVDALEDGNEEGKTVALLLACSIPLDLDECISMARRSNVVLQTIGVFGLSPEDPEPGLQELVDAAAHGSSLRIFFGQSYWTKFIAVRERQFQKTQQDANGGEAVENINQGEDEIVDPKVFEMRLIERIMRECYSEEQQCEQELTCATRVFERTLIDNEDLRAVLRGDHFRSLGFTHTPTAPATARRSSREQCLD
jgi:hypothetical protein